MYLFDLEGLDCVSIPSDWSDYATTLRELNNAAMRCFGTYYTYSIESNSLSISTVNKLTVLRQELNEAINSHYDNMDILTDKLFDLNSTNCFDRIFYDNYIASFKTIYDIHQRMIILVETNGDGIGFNFNVGVELTKIESGSYENKPYKCNSVYIKQINSGSEFIGSVNSKAIYEGDIDTTF